jgi:hypothetical protein
MPKKCEYDARSDYQYKEALWTYMRRFDNRRLDQAIRTHSDKREVLKAYEDLFTETGHSELNDITEASLILYACCVGYQVTQADVDSYVRLKHAVLDSSGIESLSKRKEFLRMLSMHVWNNPEEEDKVLALIHERGYFKEGILQEMNGVQSPLANGVL